MAKQKRHHYIPRFYLDNFTNEESGRVTVYKGDTYFQSTPERTGFQNNLYSLDGITEDIPTDDIEKRFTDVESDASTAFRKIVEKNFPTQEERDSLSLFISLLVSRVPSRLENINLQMSMVGNKLFEYEIKSDESKQKEICEVLGLRWDKEKDRDELKSLLDGFKFSPPQKAELAFVFIGEELARYLTNMRWQFFINETDTDFITSDDPVLVTREEDTELGVGIGIRDAVLFFPISKKMLLVASWSDGDQGFFPITRNQVLAVNKELIIQSYDQVYSPSYHKSLHKTVINYQNICLAPAIDIVHIPEKKEEYVISNIKLVEHGDNYDPRNYKLFKERTTHRLPSKLNSLLSVSRLDNIE